MADRQRRRLGVDLNGRHVQREFGLRRGDQKTHDAVNPHTRRGAEAQPDPWRIFAPPQAVPFAPDLERDLERDLATSFSYAERNGERPALFVQLVGWTFEQSRKPLPLAFQLITAA